MRNVLCVFIKRFFTSKSSIETVGHILMSTPTNERTQAHCTPSSLAVTRPSNNRGRRCLTSVNVPLSSPWSPPQASSSFTRWHHWASRGRHSIVALINEVLISVSIIPLSEENMTWYWTVTMKLSWKIYWDFKNTAVRIGDNKLEDLEWLKNTAVRVGDNKLEDLEWL